MAGETGWVGASAAGVDESRINRETILTLKRRDSRPDEKPDAITIFIFTLLTIKDLNKKESAPLFTRMFQKRNSHAQTVRA